MAASSRGTAQGAPALALDDAAVESLGRKAAQVENTRRALLDAARELFTEHGYGATRTEEIVQRAGVTRGALYHHFRDKEDLFRAVLEDLDNEVDASLLRRTGARNESSWDLFRANSEIHLSAATKNQAYRQIALVDGPSVFGWTEWNERRGGPQAKIASYLRRAVDEGSIDDVPVEPLAQMLASIGVGSALYIAQADDPETAHAEVSAITERLLAGLRSTPSQLKSNELTRNKERH